MTTSTGVFGSGLSTTARLWHPTNEKLDATAHAVSVKSAPRISPANSVQRNWLSRILSKYWDDKSGVFWVAHASRVLVSASRRNALRSELVHADRNANSAEKLAITRTRLPGTRD